MLPFLAALPILAVLVLMLGLRWSAARAGIAGALAAALIGITVFRFPGEAAPELPIGVALSGTLAEAAFTALTILWIIGPALGIHELQLRTGAADVLRQALGSFAPDAQSLALLVAWFFVLFMEGAAGFGASVALAAPFLVAAGFRPVDAVTISLIGHVVGVSFGAVGTPILPQMAVTGVSGLELARAAGVYHSLLGWIPLAAMMLLVRRSAVSGAAPPSSVRTAAWTAAAFVCFAVPYTLLWAFAGPELPTLGGALFGGIAFALLLRTCGRSHGPVEAPASPGRPGMPDHVVAPGTAPPAGAVLRAAAPYLVLLTIVLTTRLIAPLRTALQTIVWQWEVHDVFAGSIQILYHPGSVLLLGFVAGAILQRAAAADVRHAFTSASLRLLPVAVALLAMLTLSRVMVHSGMTGTMAAAAVAVTGSFWPAFAPFVGTLGTFVTGSATASNILFTDLQRETALNLNRSVAGMAGAQNFGAAVGNMICPHNIVAAGATVGLTQREGEILRRTLPLTLLYAAAGGMLALWFVR